MQDRYEGLSTAVDAAISGMDSPLYEEAEVAIRETLDRLYARGIITLREDYALSGRALECRVEQVFKTMSLDIRRGRPSLEDFVVLPPSGMTETDPIVLEVKSSTNPQVRRDDLRQLDDWVYDLSGEEKARKRKRPGRNVFYIAAGLPPGPRRHPSPHKGVMVFNGPIGTAFEDRVSNCIAPNNEGFAAKRNFCIIPFGTLISELRRFERGDLNIEDFWTQIETTCGVFPQD